MKLKDLDKFKEVYERNILIQKLLKFRSYTYDYKKIYSLVLVGKHNLRRWEEEIKPENPKFLKNVNDWRNMDQ